MSVLAAVQEREARVLTAAAAAVVNPGESWESSTFLLILLFLLVTLGDGRPEWFLTRVFAGLRVGVEILEKVSVGEQRRSLFARKASE